MYCRFHSIERKLQVICATRIKLMAFTTEPHMTSSFSSSNWDTGTCLPASQLVYIPVAAFKLFCPYILRQSIVLFLIEPVSNINRALAERTVAKRLCAHIERSRSPNPPCLVFAADTLLEDTLKTRQFSIIKHKSTRDVMTSSMCPMSPSAHRFNSLHAVLQQCCRTTSVLHSNPDPT